MKICALKKLGTQSGFSLLEMLLVVLILSTLAFSTLDFVDNKDNQARFEDTRHRLQLIRKAVVGESGAVYNGQRLLSGYAFDNGVLPSDIQGLLSKPTGFDSYGLKDPIFDPQPDANGINDGAGTPLNNPEEKLSKGHRGSYLTPPPSSTTPPPFYDGWNADTLDINNFGWEVSNTPLTLFTAESFGADKIDDGTPGAGTGPYDADIPMTDVSGDDWEVDVNGWAVKIRNESMTLLSVAVGSCVRVSLLAYINKPDQVNEFNWKRLTSECILGDLAIMGEANVLFLAGPPQPPTRIPAGEHLLVLVVDTDPTIHNGTELPCKGSENCIAGDRTTTHVTLFPRASLPSATLVIR